MTEAEARGVAEYIVKLYPKLDWPDEILVEFVRRVRWLDIDNEQAKAALKDQLMKAKGFKARKPEPSDLFERLAACVQKRKPEAAPDVPRYHPDTPPVTGFTRELCQRYDFDRNDAIFQRLKAQGISVFVATRGMRGKPESEDDFAAAGAKHGESVPFDPKAGEIHSIHGKIGILTARRGTASEKLEPHELAQLKDAFTIKTPVKHKRWDRIAGLVKALNKAEKGTA